MRQQAIEKTPTQASRPPLETLDKVPYHHLLSYLTTRDAVRLSMASSTLWKKSQPLLLLKFFRDSHQHSAIEGLSFLIDAIDLCPIFKKHRIDYAHLALTLTRAQPLLDTMLKSDPDCAWKIAAICDMTEATEALFQGDDIVTKRDQYNRGYMAYLVLGGNLSTLKAFIAQHHTPEGFEDDPTTAKFATILSIGDFDSKLAIMAAIGGHIDILEFLRDELNYDLSVVFPAKEKNHHPETLLTYAVKSGDQATIDFLLAQGANPNIGRHLAFHAASSGHWLIYNKLTESGVPQEEIRSIAEYAARTGNLTLTLSLIKDHHLNPTTLARDVIDGGHPNVFWHFVEQGWFTLDTQFSRGEKPEHLLAQEGHLELLKAVLERKKANNNAIYVLDNKGQSLSFYAAAGGHWHIHTYLLEKHDGTRLLQPDVNGNNIAHIAAEQGNVWFLKRLQQSNPALIQASTKNGNTILDCANINGAPNLLNMITSIIDGEAKQSTQKTAIIKTTF